MKSEHHLPSELGLLPFSAVAVWPTLPQPQDCLGLKEKIHAAKGDRGAPGWFPQSLISKSSLFCFKPELKGFSWAFLYFISYLWKHSLLLDFDSVKIRLETSEKKNMVNSLLVWWYFKFWYSFPVRLLLQVEERGDSVTLWREQPATCWQADFIQPPQFLFFN